jgi:hypothetical protein
MKKFCGVIAVIAILSMSKISTADMISTLRNTGVNVAGTAVLAHNAAETNYSLDSKPAASTSSLVAITSAGGFPVGSWLADNATSRWIRPNNGNDTFGNDNDPAGEYVFKTTFDMSGLIAATASITGKWASDNTGTKIELNGNLVSSSTATNGFGQWTNFAITNSSFFVSGLNTLKFYVTNLPQSTGNPAGLRVEMIGNATAAGPSGSPEPVPLPASLALLLTGIPGIGLLVGRKKKIS